MLYFNSFFYQLQYEWGLSILLLNIFTYVILLFLIFSLIFCFNLNNIKTLNLFKKFSSLNYIYMVFFLALLSLAGMPPLLGFVGKFLIVIFLFLKNQYFYFLIFSLVNFFMIYFYIQNFRFAVKKNKSDVLIVNNTLTLNWFFFFNLVLFLNFFGIFFLNDFLIILNNISFFLILG